jgi:hypothetical protein
MGQRVFIPLPGPGTLSLEEETYRHALEEGASFNLPPEPSEVRTSVYPIQYSWLRSYKFLSRG